MNETLTEEQRSTLRRAVHLDSQGLLFMPGDVGQRSRVAAFVRRGLMEFAGEGVHEDSGREGAGYRLTDAGRKAVSP